jgi:hypothetical protein
MGGVPADAGTSERLDVDEDVMPDAARFLSLRSPRSRATVLVVALIVVGGLSARNGILIAEVAVEQRLQGDRCPMPRSGARGCASARWR